MLHAFQCAGDCVRCKGEGTLGRGRRLRVCKKCGGSGNCAEWRGTVPPKFPCRSPDCCLCSGNRCLWLGCKLCFFLRDGVLQVNEAGCDMGACPSCGGNYVDWFSYDVAPEDVYLNSEWDRVPQGNLTVRGPADETDRSDQEENEGHTV